MNAHTKLTMHLSRHMYKRGVFKGDAPADKSKRAKRHFRVIKGNGGQMIVRMHNADLITAYEDGRIVLNTNGWHASPTTRACMSEALRGFTEQGGWLSSTRKFNMSQTGICIRGKTYRYYDGMAFSGDGTLLSEAKCFERKIADRDERAEFRREAKESGFIGLFPVLYETAGVRLSPTYVRRRSEAVCDADQAHNWPGLISDFKYPTYYHRTRGTPARADHKAALKALMAGLTKNMTVIVKSDVTVL